MKKYIEVTFPPLQPGQSDLLVGDLTREGYYGFLEEENGSVRAYILPEDYDPAVPEMLARQLSVNFTVNELDEANWNAEWESSFEPVTVDKFVTVRADFHTVTNDTEYEIVITPKMSFGTGHHATTYLMLEAMKKIEWKGKNVLDFGTGTGILAILAEKLGAVNVLAIDNDPWSMENARENLERNRSNHIVLMESDSLPAGRRFDCILANINRHILLEHASSLAGALETGGILLMSGILREDIPVILENFEPLLGPVGEIQAKNNWQCLAFIQNRGK